MKTLAPSSSVVGMVWVCNGSILCTQQNGVKACERCLQTHRVRAQAQQQAQRGDQVLFRHCSSACFAIVPEMSFASLCLLDRSHSVSGLLSLFGLLSHALQGMPFRPVIPIWIVMVQKGQVVTR